MKLSDLTLPSLDLVPGMEKRLRERRRGATGSLFVALAAFAVQFVLAATDPAYVKNLKALGRVAKSIVLFDFKAVASSGMLAPELIGAGIVIVGVVGYIVLRWTSVLLKESEECFRYSFDVAEITPSRERRAIAARSTVRIGSSFCPAT